MDRENFMTERRLPESMALDAMSIEEALAVMNEQDAAAVAAVTSQRDAVAQAVQFVAAAFEKGGRLIYLGAGTSGRLGVLDAAECPPTFRSDPQMVQGIIAGGEKAMFKAVEGAEDSAESGAVEIDARKVNANDVVLGIAAGGTTPFVHGGLRRAWELGATTIFLTCVEQFAGEPQVDLVIRLLTGPEVLTGSTRLKAGTATKLVLNQITTLAMVQAGKVYENLMVDLRATNEKLWDRGARIISTLTGLDRDQSMQLLKRSDGQVKAAVVMQKLNVDFNAAQRRLEHARGRLRDALKI